MKKTKVILELYLEIWYCYRDGKSMAYPLFTCTSYEEADAECKKRGYDVIQTIALELEDINTISDYKEQPKNVLVEYIEYVESKIDIGEVPLAFCDWAGLEIDNDSPISKHLEIELN